MLELLQDPLFLTLVIVIIGEAIGKITIRSVSLGSAAIMFVGIVFGHFGYVLPSSFQILGLVLFIYAIGLQAGPGFLGSFKEQGLKYAIAAILIVAGGVLITICLAKLAGYNSRTAAGLFAGSLASNTALATAIEMTTDKNVISAFSVTYPLGVIGIILFMRFVTMVLKIDINKEEHLLAQLTDPPEKQVIFRNIEINNPNLFNKTIGEIQLSQIAPVTITRLCREGTTRAILVDKHTVIYPRDRIRIVGTRAALDKIGIFLGSEITSSIEFEGGLVVRKVVVSKKSVIGRSLLSLQFRETFDVQISRIRRNAIELPVDPGLKLHMGDVLSLVGRDESIKNFGKFVGNDLSSTYRVDIISMIIGLVFGILIGKIPVMLPGIGLFHLGVSGGVLLSGIILGHLHSTRSMIWAMPGTARDSIRQLGLMLFMAAAGTIAGAGIFHTLQHDGLLMLVIGAVITFGTLVWGLFLSYRLFKIPYLCSLGVLTGSVTSTPGLASTNTISNTSYAASCYASVYPVALVTIIIFTKLILILMLG